MELLLNLHFTTCFKVSLSITLQNGRWRWSDESTYNYQAWIEGAPKNLEKNEYCVELKRSASVGATVGGNELQQILEGGPNDQPGESCSLGCGSVCSTIRLYICCSSCARDTRPYILHLVPAQLQVIQENKHCSKMADSTDWVGGRGYY